MKADDVIATVFLRNSFYRRQYLLALLAFLLSLIVIGFLGWVLVYLYNNPTRPLYFATDSVGRLITIVPLDRPNMSEEEIRAWAIEAVQKANSYDYVNYRSQLQDTQKYFAAYGWTQYINALELSGNLLALNERKQVVIAQVADKPTLTAEGMLGGAYAWQYTMPVLVTYFEPPYDKPKYYNALNVKVIVQRQPILQSYKGLGVVQMLATLANAPAEPQELSNTPQ